MGGMFIGHYAIKHHELVENLIFMSSVGVSSTPDILKPDTVLNSLDSRLARYGGKKVTNIMFDYPWTPFDAYRMSGKYFAMRSIYSGLKRRVDPSIFTQGEAEMALFANYIHLMMVRKKSSELCVNRIFMPFAYTRVPLEPLLPQLKGHQIRK